jgi:hypothetical protein
MTALPQPRSGSEDRLRVVRGRRLARPTMAPWMIMALIAVVGFLGLGFARTSLDRAAFDLAELDGAIAEQHALNLELKMEIARLENPARIAPLAEDLGLVIPSNTNQLLVDLSPAGPAVADAEHEGATQ